MRTRWIRRILPAVVLAGALGACQDGPTDAKAGELTLSFATPHADDVALLISLTGPGEIRDVVAANPAHLLHARAEGETLRAVIFGELKEGPLLRFTVPDVSRAESYTATVLEVSDPANALRASTAGYSLSISR